MNERSTSILFEAMMHLEWCDDTRPAEDIMSKVCYAHYLIQYFVSGVKPDNWDEIKEMAEFMEIADINPDGSISAH